jgi:pSer/pThr/pTyr-binding forkhead associated (FHA) protein
MASIIVKLGTDEEKDYPLGKRTNVIGRDEAAPIQILDEHISRKHLQIRFDKESELYYALDMKSKHGVFINGHKIEQEVILNDGDNICIGETNITFLKEDFPDKESALAHYKKVGERKRSTLG